MKGLSQTGDQEVDGHYEISSFVEMRKHHRGKTLCTAPDGSHTEAIPSAQPNSQLGINMRT